MLTCPQCKNMIWPVSPNNVSTVIINCCPKSLSMKLSVNHSPGKPGLVESCSNVKSTTTNNSEFWNLNNVVSISLGIRIRWALVNRIVTYLMVKPFFEHFKLALVKKFWAIALKYFKAFLLVLKFIFSYCHF